MAPLASLGKRFTSAFERRLNERRQVNRVVLRAAAARDIEKAVNWYNRQTSGLGSAFVSAVNDAMQSIGQHPLAYPVVYRQSRRVVLQDFPYLLFYRQYGEVILVLACVHGKRHPKRWRSRIRSEENR